MNVFGWALIHFVWQGAAVAIVLAAALRMMRGASPQQRYAAACVALLVMALMAPLTALVIASNSSGSAISQAPAMPGSRLVIASSETGSSALEAIRGGLEQRIPWLVSLWALGASALLLRSAGGWYLARKGSRAGAPMDYPLSILMERLGMTGTVEVFQSAKAVTPQVFGWLKPVIVVPVAVLAQLPASQLEALLAHELAHIRRRDYLVNLLQTVVESVLFYHPAVWWVSTRIRVERELCCDDIAVEACGDSREYSRALLRLEEVRPAMALAASGSGLKERIARLLGAQRQESSRPAGPAAALVAATVLMGGAWWLQAAPPAQLDAPAAPAELALALQPPPSPPPPAKKEDVKWKETPPPPPPPPPAVKKSVESKEAPPPPPPPPVKARVKTKETPPPPPPPPPKSPGSPTGRVTDVTPVGPHGGIRSLNTRGGVGAGVGGGIGAGMGGGVGSGVGDGVSAGAANGIDGGIPGGIVRVSFEDEQRLAEVTRQVEAEQAVIRQAQAQAEEQIRIQTRVQEQAQARAEEQVRLQARAQEQIDAQARMQIEAHQRTIEEVERGQAKLAQVQAQIAAISWDAQQSEQNSAAQKEHERRIRYADQRFAEGSVKGSETDRGKLYVQYGPPDEINVRPGVWENWIYGNWQGTGSAKTFEFDGKGKRK